MSALPNGTADRRHRTEIAATPRLHGRSSVLKAARNALSSSWFLRSSANVHAGDGLLRWLLNCPPAGAHRGERFAKLSTSIGTCRRVPRSPVSELIARGLRNLWRTPYKFGVSLSSCASRPSGTPGLVRMSGLVSDNSLCDVGCTWRGCNAYMALKFIRPHSGLEEGSLSANNSVRLSP
jgi:hypothetical protein